MLMIPKFIFSVLIPAENIPEWYSEQFAHLSTWLSKILNLTCQITNIHPKSKKHF